MLQLCFDVDLPLNGSCVEVVLLKRYLRGSYAPLFLVFFDSHRILFFLTLFSSILDQIGIAGLSFLESLTVSCSMWRSAVEGMERILQSVSSSQRMHGRRS